MRKHPSGRPISRDKYVRYGFHREPVGPLVPGLRKGRDFTNAIGFTADIGGEEDGWDIDRNYKTYPIVRRSDPDRMGRR